jgi:simple sugar transport system permease protein
VNETLKAVTRNRLFWPALVLVGLLLLNTSFSTHFLSITLRDGHLYGSLIDIMRQSSALILVALGMTLVIATGGIDLSVGSVMAIAGGMACLQISGLGDQGSLPGVLFACAVALLVALAVGVWNGMLVSVIGVQPIIATLILLVGGRGIAQLITDGQVITVRSPPYHVIGAGYALGLPVSVLIAAAIVAFAILLTRRSALGLLLESVGGNPSASRLSGIRARRLIWAVYVVAALCAGVAGLIDSSDVSSADGNNTGNLIELDAILAVVIGGTALAGGRYSISGSVLGSVIITSLDITVVTIGVPTNATLLFKAIVVIVLCLLQSPSFRAVLGMRRRVPPAEPPAAAPVAEEVPA